MPKEERREFFRLKFNNAVEIKTYDDSGQNQSTYGKTDNISQSGILFQTEHTPPKVSSILWLGLDIRTLKICQEIEARALILNNGIFGKVVRVEEDESGYDVGVCFLKKEQKDSREVQELLKKI
jgi:hypothetical protein